MIPICIPSLSESDKKYLIECIDSSFVSSVGKFLNIFADEIGKATGIKYVIPTSSGTEALHLSLHALGVKHNDLVIIPSFTFIATANAVAHCSATPWIFDITEDSLELDLNLVDKILSQETTKINGELIYQKTNQKVKAIIPVFPIGNPCDLDKISSISEKYNLPVIIDAAAGIGTKNNGNQLGKSNFDLMTFSFNGNKTITSGAGGAVATNDKKLFEQISHLSSTARTGRNYNHDMVGFNYRMSNIQAALGYSQIQKLDKFLTKKKEIFFKYQEGLQELINSNKIKMIPNESNDNSYWLSGIILDKNYNPEEIREKLQQNNIESRGFWKPMHLQKPFSNAPRTKQDNVEDIWERIIILPSSVDLKQADQEHVINILTQIL